MADITDKLIKDQTKDTLKAFFDNAELSDTVLRAFQTFLSDPAEQNPSNAHAHWVFNIDRSLSDEAYGRTIRAKVEAMETLLAAFAGMRMIANGAVPSQKKNEAR